MRRVRNILAEYGIEVLSVPKQGIVLQGAERSIRTMVYDVINNAVGVISPQEEQKASVNLTILNRYISLHWLKKLDDLYVRSMTSLEETIYRNQLLMFTAVWLSRYLREDLIASSVWEAPIHLKATFVILSQRFAKPFNSHRQKSKSNTLFLC